MGAPARSNKSLYVHRPTALLCPRWSWYVNSCSETESVELRRECFRSMKPRQSADAAKTTGIGFLGNQCYKIGRLLGTQRFFFVFVQHPPVQAGAFGIKEGLDHSQRPQQGTVPMIHWSPGGVTLQLCREKTPPPFRQLSAPIHKKERVNSNTGGWHTQHRIFHEIQIHKIYIINTFYHICL